MKKNLLLLAIVVLLAIIPLFIQKGAEFGGADGEAEATIGEINAEYEPWFESLWEPPSGEIESLLFVLQADYRSWLYWLLHRLYAWQTQRRLTIMLLIDKYAYLNKLASVHPLEK